MPGKEERARIQPITRDQRKWIIGRIGELAQGGRTATYDVPLEAPHVVKVTYANLWLWQFAGLNDNILVPSEGENVPMIDHRYVFSDSRITRRGMNTHATFTANVSPDGEVDSSYRSVPLFQEQMANRSTGLHVVTREMFPGLEVLLNSIKPKHRVK